MLFFCRSSGKDFPREESQPVQDHSKGHLLKTCHLEPRNGSDTEPAPRNYLGWSSHKEACSRDGDGSQRGPLTLESIPSPARRLHLISRLVGRPEHVESTESK